ncbi:unnamed protein product [Lampetra fluviatilis]
MAGNLRRILEQKLFLRCQVNQFIFSARQHEQYQQHQQHRAACSSISYSSSSSIRILQQQRNRAASAESSSAASIVQQHHQQHGALHTLPPTRVSPLTATQKPQPPLNATWAGESVAGVRTRMQRARGGEPLDSARREDALVTAAVSLYRITRRRASPKLGTMGFKAL